ncbi:MAG: ribose-phosphate pyrophosphokinase [Candidatus Marinimicrobia bacterium]|jgi:ribose-phosphate pyrophosphokinase|nr:ribose-phosphate pyrophosphokinase [Candidatus Neomarinimicrobiota bacterium]MDP6593856.1 ribose-phosphate pyrophosphokinase [Candidatus Neomarinimicrobiota bacterium]MDP6835906.1 ribose-phosphate pyrophosphokinase [Candidatus Neomarinimicrobiota bacterium]MDP6967104.1 ribose-phosphate pyrophosphokinase [Candidatus Neomarinimicrobiota bacterium]|tara:strand:- start:864 stop:1796 length:933 start_codon:yes stop_codon:yes gene_type:complete
MKIFSGRSNVPLAEKIADHLGTELGKVNSRQFSDGELWVKYEENIRGQDVFIIQSTHHPADNIIELVLMIDAAVRASARRVTAVIPYYGYGRQDRKDQPRVPISARVMIDLISSVGVGRILAMDLHSSQIQGFTHIPFDHLYARQVIFERLREFDLSTETTMILAPDAGRAPMAQSFAKHLGVGFGLVDKRRTGPNQAEVVHLIGDLKGKEVIVIDDMIDTGGTTINAANAAIESGASNVVAVATHGLFSGDAVERIMSSNIGKVIVTDTVNLNKKREFDKLEEISVSGLFARAVECIHNGESVSALFEF